VRAILIARVDWCAGQAAAYPVNILIADEEFRVGERASEDEKCIAFFTASQ
jgi:hypothetical protein